jgi:hypothetical protein
MLVSKANQPLRWQEWNNEGDSGTKRVLRQLGFKPDNLLMLQQPQLTGLRMPIEFAVESYFESLRDLARFIDSVCRRKKTRGFAWMNSILTKSRDSLENSQDIQQFGVALNIFQPSVSTFRCRGRWNFFWE